MKTKIMTADSRSRLLGGIALMGAGALTLPAQQLTYQLLETATINDYRTSDGSFQPIGMDYSAGYFTPSFTPSASNFTDWSSNWTIVDATTLRLLAVPYVGVSRLTPVFVPVPPEDSQIYIWGTGGATDPTAEQLLVTNSDLTTSDGMNWIFSTGPVTAPVPSISAQDDGVIAVVGALEGVAGEGIITSLIPGAETHIQSAVISLVPEPSSALLAAMGSLFFLRRKRSQ